MIAIAAGLAMPVSARVTPAPSTAEFVRLDAQATALKAQLQAASDPALADFYAARNYRPLWVQAGAMRADARAISDALAGAAADGLRPETYDPERVAQAAAAHGDVAALARAELTLSAALAAWGADLHTPKPGAEMVYTDAAVAPPQLDRRSVLELAARAGSPVAAVAAVRRMNPLYDQLRQALAAHRATAGDPRTEALILANLERARALPTDPGRRYVLVDVAAQELRLYQAGEVVDSMPVVIGKVSEPTPQLAGLIRYAVFRPYWRVPPDLVRTSVAPKVLTLGTEYLEGQGMEPLSAFGPEGQAISPEAVDWQAVAAGEQLLPLRQRPGPHNMMGQVKFMFPNRLGVYLHDTPLKGLFAGAQRTESAGCVRLADAPRLARWLLGDAAAGLDAPGEPESRVDLPEPTPVYIVYLTALPGPGGLETRRDIYGRDRRLIAELTAPASASS